MANRKLSEIKDALASLIASMTEAGDYYMDVDATHVFKQFNQTTVSNKADDSYPKFFVLVESGDNAKEPAGRVAKHLSIWIVAIVKKILEEDDAPNVQMEALAEDFEKLLTANDTLNGTVEDVVLKRYKLDAGELAPEGAGVFELDITYFKQF